MNCSIHLMKIPNYRIPWDIDYTQACATPIAKIKTCRVYMNQICIYRYNDYFKHCVKWSTSQTSWKPTSQSFAQVEQRAIWLLRQRKEVSSPLDRADRDDISSSNAEQRYTTVASIEQGLNRRLMSSLDNHHSHSLTYRPCCKCVQQCKKPMNTRFSILDDAKTLQPCENASSSLPHVAIQTRPHPEKNCIISWWLKHSPPGGPSPTNHMNCLLIRLKRRHRNCYCHVPNAFCIAEMTEILIVIDIVREVGKSLDTPSNVIL